MKDGVELSRFGLARKPVVDSTDSEDLRLLNDRDSAPNKYGRKKTLGFSCINLALFLLLIASAIFVAIDFSFSKMNYIRKGLGVVLTEMENDTYGGFIIFTVTYVVTTVLFVPGSILTLGAGYAFAQSLGMGMGVLVASLAVQTGATVGALVSFLLARHLLYETVQGWIVKYPKMKAVEKALTYNGLTVLCLLRLSPIIPWGPLNYMMGVTGMPFKIYALSCLAMIPDTVAWVYVGASLRSVAKISLGKSNYDGTEDNGKADGTTLKHEWIITGVGLVATVVAVYVLTLYSNKMLKKTIKKGQDEKRPAEVQQLRLDSDSHLEP